MTLKQYYEQAKKLKEIAQNIDLNAWGEGYECGYEDGKNDQKTITNQLLKTIPLPITYQREAYAHSWQEPYIKACEKWFAKLLEEVNKQK